jgi:hypothetical protein
MLLDYKQKVIKALELAENLNQVYFIEEKLRTTPVINRYTKQGRELTQELQDLANQKAHQLIKQGEQPF